MDTSSIASPVPTCIATQESVLTHHSTGSLGSSAISPRPRLQALWKHQPQALEHRWAERYTCARFDITSIRPPQRVRQIDHFGGVGATCINSTFDVLAGLANVFGQQRAILDALEDLLGFLTIRRRGVAHICNCIVHFRRYRLAFLRGVDQFGSHRFNFYSLGGGKIDCSYTSLAQCNASASGRAAQRLTNPFFALAHQAPPSRGYRRR